MLRPCKLFRDVLVRTMLVTSVLGAIACCDQCDVKCDMKCDYSANHAENENHARLTPNSRPRTKSTKKRRNKMIIDSGASIHCIRDLSLFTTLDTSKQAY